MEFKVKTPSSLFSGVRAGVQFNKGVGTFEDEALVAVFKTLGYEVEIPKKEVKETKTAKKSTTKKSGE